VETNDDVIAANQKFFDEHRYWPTTYVERKRGYPKQEACDNPECYHRFPEHIIFRDIQRDSARTRRSESPASGRKYAWSETNIK
jgi:hypothetical protein